MSGTVKKKTVTVSSSSWARGAVYLTAVVYLLWLGLSMLLPGQSEGTGNVRIYEYGIILQLSGLLVPAAFWYSLRGSRLSGKMRLSLFSPAKAVFLLLFTAALVCFAVLCAIFMANGSGSIILDTAYTGNGGWAAALCLAILPAVAEEVFFRGILMTELDACGAPAAVIVSSALFAMFHFSLEKLPLYFFSGLLLALAVYVTRSLLASLSVHLAYNLIALFGTEKLNAFLSATDELALPAAVLGIILLICLILIFGECQRTFAFYADQNRVSHVAGNGGAGALLLTVFSPAGALCIIIFIVAILQ